MNEPYYSYNPSEIDDWVAKSVEVHLHGRLGIPKWEQNLDVPLQELGADLLDRIEFVVTAEELFNIHVPFNVATEIETVRDLIDMVKKVIDLANQK